MARYTGADCRRCRREKMKLFLKGAKCDSPKCPIEIRPYPPGEHGRGRTKDSEYLMQMREEQRHGPPARQARPLRRQRAEGRHPELPRRGERHRGGATWLG